MTALPTFAVTDVVTDTGVRRYDGLAAAAARDLTSARRSATPACRRAAPSPERHTTATKADSRFGLLVGVTRMLLRAAMPSPHGRDRSVPRSPQFMAARRELGEYAMTFRAARHLFTANDAST